MMNNRNPKSLTRMETKSTYRRCGASLVGVIGVLALIGAIACLCLGMQKQGDTLRTASVADVPPLRRVSANAELTIPIEHILVGQRVMAGNPQMTAGHLDQISEIVPDQWRKVALEMTKADGGGLDIVLLRPTSWLLASGAQAGDEIYLDMPELGAVGPAKVISVELCPQILPGGGRVVTGTFAHRSGEVIDLGIEGQSSPIGTTATHPFWSEDRQEFIPAGQLRQGELLRTLAGQAQVVSIVPRAGPEPVYNIEVHGEHVYRVAANGVLVHNKGGVPDGKFYSVAYEMELNPNSYPGASRYMHFKGGHPHWSKELESRTGLPACGARPPITNYSIGTSCLYQVNSACE